MVGDTEFLDRFGAVLADELLRLDTIILEEFAHGIEVLYWHDIVLCVVEEHHVKVAAGLPSAGEGILGEGSLEPARQGAVGIEEDGRSTDVTRLFGLDKFLVKGLTLVLLAEKPLVEVAGHGILQIVVPDLSGGLAPVIRKKTSIHPVSGISAVIKQTEVGPTNHFDQWNRLFFLKKVLGWTERLFLSIIWFEN